MTLAKDGFGSSVDQSPASLRRQLDTWRARSRAKDPTLRAEAEAEIQRIARLLFKDWLPASGIPDIPTTVKKRNSGRADGQLELDLPL